MAASPDYDLRPDGVEPPFYDRPGRPKWLWIIVGLLVVAAGAAIYYVYGPRPPEPVAEAPAPAPPPPTSPTQPLGAEPFPVEVPPLDLSDPIVRELLGKLSQHPRVLAWLTTDGLVRNFTATVLNVSEGRVPTLRLATLKAPSSIQFVQRGGSWYVDPKSYDRYNGVADAVASVAPADAARLFATLKPRIEQAYMELGVGGSFDAVLERAIVQLLETPVLNDPPRVEPLSEGIGYGFTDARLEELTAAQKQLLRTGPRNTRIIQASLRQTALSLGIAPDRLPAPR
jgi:hypothetical protein